MYSYLMFCTIIDVKSRIINISWPSEKIVQSVEQAPVLTLLEFPKFYSAGSGYEARYNLFFN